MVFLFRDKAVSNILFLLLLAIAVHFHFFISPTSISINNNDGVFGFLLEKFLKPLNAALLFAIYMVMIIFQALRLNIAINQYKMINQQHYTVAMSYILLTGFFAEWSLISAALVANFFVIWIFLQLSKLHNHTQPKALLFNTGFLIGVTIIGYQPAFSLIVITILALAIVRPFRISEWLILLIGTVLPFYFLGSYLFLTNQFILFKKFLPWFQPHLPVKNTTPFFWISFSILALLTLAGFYYNQQNANRMVIQIRKNWSFVLLLLLFMLPTCFMYHGATFTEVVLCIVPIAAIAANAFSYPKKLLLPNLLFWLSVAVIIYNNWMLVKK